jgi:hypothetical protein
LAVLTVGKIVPLFHLDAEGIHRRLEPGFPVQRLNDSVANLQLHAELQATHYPEVKLSRQQTFDIEKRPDQLVDATSICTALAT